MYFNPILKACFFAGKTFQPIIRVANNRKVMRSPHRISVLDKFRRTFVTRKLVDKLEINMHAAL